MMTDLPIRKGLQKPNIAGRMVRLSVELSEFDIHYMPISLLSWRLGIPTHIPEVFYGYC